MLRSPGARAPTLVALALLVGAARPDPTPVPACPAPALLGSGPAGPRVGCGGGPRLRGPARLLFGLRLDAARAQASAFEVLPGIGPARAQALVRAGSARRCVGPGISSGPTGSARRLPGTWPRCSTSAPIPAVPGPRVPGARLFIADPDRPIWGPAQGGVP